MGDEERLRDERIDYLELAVGDLAEAKRFYGEAFGWTFQDWGDAYVSFEESGLPGGFRPAEQGADPASGGGASGGGASGGGAPLPILYALDLEGMAERVKRAGGTIVREIFAFPGGRRFHFTDPAGNELAVWSDRGV